VLFCDVVGSTGIATRLDPEQWRETIAGYHRAAAEAIVRFDGHVAKYLGDGVMAYFGYPQAHDNDAERAVRAGLAILDAIPDLNQQPAHAKLSTERSARPFGRGDCCGRTHVIRRSRGRTALAVESLRADA